MATRMQQRRGTAAQWTSANPVLVAGEIGFETDTNKFKIGDDSTTWSNLPYFTTLDDIVDGAPGLLDTLNELAAAIGDDPNFITTITTSANSKLPKAGGTMTGHIVLSGAPTENLHPATKSYADAIETAKLSKSGGTMTGHIVLTGAPTENLHPATKNYVDTYADAIETALSGEIDGVEESLGILSDAVTFLIVSDAKPTTGARAGEALQSGDLWYSNSNGQFYVYYEYDTDEYYWVEVGGANENKDTAIGTDSHDFPADPDNGDLHKGYIYDSARNAWKIDRTSEISDNSDVNVSDPSNNEVLMYNSTTSVFENVAGIALDGNGEIPTSYIPSAIARVASVAGMTAKTTVQWSSDTSIPAEGSLNVELATELRIKIGNGVDTFADLEYVPSIGSVDTQIATAIADKAPKADPTFTGTVSLPSGTSIGDVSSTEIGYLDGVTSSVQTQLNTLGSDKAPKADPTFTGTVSGVTKTHVGLANVDNTADADKPVSTATQTALDAKASLAGATFTGDVTVETDVVIEGNLTISGTTTTVNATDLSISDPLIYLAAEQYTEDVLDVGFLAATGEVGGTEESHLHSGFFRDVSDSGKWKLVSNVPHPVNNVVDITNAVKDTLVIGNLEADGVVFADGTQTKAGVPSLTAFTEKTASYTLDTLDHKDNIVEMNSSSPVTFTIPANDTLAWPVGTSMDIFATGTGAVTIAGADGVTVNATPGLVLRTQWSSATILKRATNSWVVYGDLKA
jgi:hypothetical protein